MQALQAECPDVDSSKKSVILEEYSKYLEQVSVSELVFLAAGLFSNNVFLLTVHTRRNRMVRLHIRTGGAEDEHTTVTGKTRRSTQN